MYQKIPNITGISEVQRRGKKALAPLFNKGKANKPVFLADRNKVFAVVLDVDSYRDLIKQCEENETLMWLQAAEGSLDFWNHPSNDVYEKLL